MDQLEFIDTKVLNRSIEEPLGVDLGAMVPGNREAFTRFVSAFYGIICVVGLAGNLMVAVVLLRVRTLRSNTSDFLVHLSAVDFMVCILVIPTNLVPAPSPTPNPGLWGEFLCRFFMSGFVFWFFTVNSVFSLIAVNLERYVAIVHPHKYKTVFTKRNKYIMIATCWILAVVTHSFHFFVFDEVDVVGCQRLGWRNLFARSAYGLYNFTINLLIPLAVMVFAQLRVISTLNTQVKMLTARAATGIGPNDQHEMWQLRASQSLVKTLLACVISFAVCWTPTHLVYLLFNFGVPVQLESPFTHMTIALAVANSCLNPIIYTLLNKPFRKGIRGAFCKQRDSNRVGEGGGPTATVTVAETLP
ncbi:QRFP-like peptide receptor [Asterias rubens]|uniref:QRFP-like peptide receptor n=1 Tax=Asterias rubens TaxID=7604 RepID=UPI00145549FA|nr:QRFP-like peptide receptor [Asterias rubens]